MSRKVVITINDTHIVDGQKETAKLSTVGRYEEKENGYLLTYKETEDFKGSETTVSFIDGVVTMKRLGGKHNAQLIVEPGKRYSCMYATEYVDLMLGVHGKEVKSRVGKDEGELFFSYTLDFNTGFCSHNELKMTFRFE